jgi:hypothetical protein
MTLPETVDSAISVQSRDGGKILFVTVTGKIVAEDYDYFVPYLEERIDEHDKVSILVELVDFHGWTAGAMWEDTKFASKHFADIERLAIVGDSRWEKGLAVFCRPFTAADVRYFDESDRAEADRWILGAASGEND